MTKRNNVIEFDHVIKKYRLGDKSITVLKGVSFVIKQREMVAVMGPSGSGKSTIMNIMGLLDRPSEGQYKLLGEDASNFNNDQRATLRNKKLGFIFQSFYLLPKLTGLQNVGLPLRYQHRPESEIKKRALELMDRVGVAHLANNKPTEMSGGEQQRMAVARALITDPDLILADEPTGALDSDTSARLMALLRELHEEREKTLVIITHDSDVGKSCERIIHVRDGMLL